MLWEGRSPRKARLPRKNVIFPLAEGNDWHPCAATNTGLEPGPGQWGDRH